MKSKKPSTKNGFTLIELTLAIAFLSVLLVTVTVIMNEIISLYKKGYSIKTVNQVGRDLIEDFTNSVQGAPPASTLAYCETYTASATSKKACEDDAGLLSIYQQYFVRIKIKSTNEQENLPYAGVFCTGQYSYIWNTGYVFGDGYEIADGSNKDKYKLSFIYQDPNNSSTKKTMENFHLIKIKDAQRNVCTQNIQTTYPSDSPAPNTAQGGNKKVVEINFAPNEEPVELLSATTDAALAAYGITIFPPAETTSNNKLLYSGSFVLGTIEGGANIKSSSNFCKTPSGYDMDFSYCAINKFNFGAQASGS